MSDTIDENLYCLKCGNPKLYPDKPCVNCNKKENNIEQKSNEKRDSCNMNRAEIYGIIIFVGIFIVYLSNDILNKLSNMHFDRYTIHSGGGITFLIDNKNGYIYRNITCPGSEKNIPNKNFYKKYGMLMPGIPNCWQQTEFL